ncbi:MAG: ribosomal L7Ae/L30e/S12e/Gadd45 family protein [Candidatus Woesearchaeota archaeon]
MEDVLQAIEVARATGKIRKGVNEVTKAVERGRASIVAVANDVSPKELILHLEPLCKEKGVQYVADVAGKEELGAAAGIARPTVCVAITQAGDAKNILKDVKKAQKEEAPAKEEPKADDSEKKSEEKESEDKKKEE